MAVFTKKNIKKGSTDYFMHIFLVNFVILRARKKNIDEAESMKMIDYHDFKYELKYQGSRPTNPSQCMTDIYPLKLWRAESLQEKMPRTVIHWNVAIKKRIKNYVSNFYSTRRRGSLSRISAQVATCGSFSHVAEHRRPRHAILSRIRGTDLSMTSSCVRDSLTACTVLSSNGRASWDIRFRLFLFDFNCSSKNNELFLF